MRYIKYLLFFLPFCFFLNVYADSFNGVQIAYNYDRGVDTDLWSGYSTTLSHNFGTTDATIGYVNTLNTILILNNNFTNGNFYSVTYNWTNEYTGYSNSFSLYDAIQEMGHFNLRCSTASTGDFSSPETCFTSTSIRFEKTSNDTVRAYVTFVPLVNFRRLLINITKDGTPEGSQLISNYFALSNFSYTISTGGTAEIIDNATQNTQDIINNNNYNTQQIIDGLNDGANAINDKIQEQLDSQKSCKTYSSSNYFRYGQLGSNGNMSNQSPVFGTSDFIPIHSDTTIKVVRIATSSSVRYCFYDDKKNFISCDSTYNKVTGSYLTIPNNTFYFKFTAAFSTDSPIFDICNNGNQAIQDSIIDSSVEPNTGTGFFNDFTSQDFGLSQIITIPLNTIQSLTSKSCVPLQIPIPFTNSNIPLPCMTEIYENKLPTIYNLWKIVSFGIIAYLIAIDIFHIVKGFKDPESDKVEVLDL